jgi:hypothetical protein
MRTLELKRHHHLLEFDYDSPDLPQAELLQKGLDRVPDSAPKFEKMLACFDVLISIAKRSQFTLDPEPELNLLYGQQPSLEGVYLRNVFRRFVAAGGPEREKGETGKGKMEKNPFPLMPIFPASAARSGQNPEAKVQNAERPPGEPERFLLLKTLFGVEQRTCAATSSIAASSSRPPRAARRLLRPQRRCRCLLDAPAIAE